MRVPAGSQMGAPHAVTIAQREYVLSRRLTLHADSRARENKQARQQSALCRTSAAVCSHARGAGTVLISTTNLVTLPAPPLCAAGSAFAAAVALLVLCLSIVCVTVCLLLSVRVCLREQPKSVHVCMCIIVCQGVSFALLLSAPHVATSRHRRRCVQFQSCSRLAVTLNEDGA